MDNPYIAFQHLKSIDPRPRNKRKGFWSWIFGH